MIVNHRKKEEHDEKQKPSLSDKLHRLRGEDARYRTNRRNKSRQRRAYDTTVQPNLSYLMKVGVESAVTSGPPAPVSWTQGHVLSEDEWAALTLNTRRNTIVLLSYFIDYLRGASDCHGVTSRLELGDSLNTMCLEMLADEMSDADFDASVLRDLPVHLRLRLINVASVSAPLPPGLIKFLLATVAGTLAPVSDAANAPQVHESWEDALPTSGPRAPEFQNLTLLNLSFSVMDTTCLHGLLLRRDVLPRFPHLETLLLAGMPLIRINYPLIRILSYLLSIKILSLSGLIPESNSVLESPSYIQEYGKWMNSLAVATPNLIAIDMSYVNYSFNELLQVKWELRWPKLKYFMSWKRPVAELDLTRNHSLRDILQHTSRMRLRNSLREQLNKSVTWTGRPRPPYFIL